MHCPQRDYFITDCVHKEVGAISLLKFSKWSKKFVRWRGEWGAEGKSGGAI